MSVSKKQQYVPIELTVLGELSSNTLGSNAYARLDYVGMATVETNPGSAFADPNWMNNSDFPYPE